MLALNEVETEISCAPFANGLSHYRIIRSSGVALPFEPSQIAIAMMKAFLAVRGICSKSNVGFARMGKLVNIGAIRASRHANEWGFMRGLTVHHSLLPKVGHRVCIAFNGFFSAGKTNLRNAP